MSKKILLTISALLFCGLMTTACGEKTTLTSNEDSAVQTPIASSSDDATKTATDTLKIMEVKKEEFKTLPGQKDLYATHKQVVIETNLGDIKIQLFGDVSPITVNNFLNLAQSGFYNGTKFHRVIKDFMIQGGDPNSKDNDLSNDGMGDPGYKFDDEFNDNKLVRGSLAMANSGPNTNGSQFFIVTATSTPWLDGHHVNFGIVIAGLDVVSKIENTPVYSLEDNLGDRQKPQDHPKTEVIIKKIDLK